jgi:hypothetical protein
MGTRAEGENFGASGGMVVVGSQEVGAVGAKNQFQGSQVEGAVVVDDLQMERIRSEGVGNQNVEYWGPREVNVVGQVGTQKERKSHCRMRTHLAEVPSEGEGRQALEYHHRCPLRHFPAIRTPQGEGLRA